MKYFPVIAIALLFLIVPASASVFYSVHDGYAYNSSSGAGNTFSAILAAGSGSGDNSTGFVPYFQASPTTNQFNLSYVYGLSFDTSSIGSDTITSAVLRMKGGSAKTLTLDGQNEVVAVVGYPTNYQDYVKGDYTKYDNQECTARLDWTSLSATANMNLTFTNYSCINKAGITTLYVVDGDYLDGTFSGTWTAGGIKKFITYGANGGAGNAPYLQIEHGAAGSAPVAGFTANTTGGSQPIPNDFAFTDTSTNTPTSWSWVFKDVSGNNTDTIFSTDQNPVLSIYEEGNFNIHLTATNAFGSDTTDSDFWINTSVFSYYAYGDSITAATTGALPDDGSKVYLFQMLDTHAPTSLKGHNMDGSGWQSSNLAARFSKYPGGILYPTNVYVMAGVNDRANSVAALTTAYNMMNTYSNYTANGSTTKILVETLQEDDGHDYADYAAQALRIYIIQEYYDDNDVTYVKAYDAIDSIPGNCMPDEWNTSLMLDEYHPNEEGHRLIGEYIWGNQCPGGNYTPPPVTPTPTPTQTPTTTPPPAGCIYTNATTVIDENNTEWSIHMGNYTWGTAIINRTLGNISWYSCYATPTATTPPPRTPEINPSVRDRPILCSIPILNWILNQCEVKK